MLTNDQSNECFLPAENLHMRMRNKIKTNRDKSSIENLELWKIWLRLIAFRLCLIEFDCIRLNSIIILFSKNILLFPANTRHKTMTIRLSFWMRTLSKLLLHLTLLRRLGGGGGGGTSPLIVSYFLSNLIIFWRRVQIGETTLAIWYDIPQLQENLLL